MQPPYPCARGSAPGPNLRRRRLLLHSSFRMLLGETEQGAPRPPYPPKTRQGPMRPPYPGSRAIGPAPFLRWRKHIVQTSFRMIIWGTEKEPTGAMKTKKRAAERMHSLTASFLSFSPDAKHPVGGVSHRPARGWLCRTQFAKTHSFSAKVCVHVALFHRGIVCMI